MIKFFKKHTWVLVAILGLVLFPQSLSYQSKIDGRVLITGIAIDKVGDEYEITAQTILPSAKVGGQTSSKATLEFVSDVAPTVFEGVEIVASKIGKVAGLGQLNFILIGKSALEDAVKLSDFAVRKGIVDSTVLLLAVDGSAKEILQETQHLDLGVAIALRRHFYLKRNEGHGVISVAQDAANNQYTESKSFVLPYVNIFIEKMIEEKNQPISVDQFQSKHARIDYLNKIALFSDNKLKGELSTEDEIWGYTVSQGRSKNMHFSVEHVYGKLFNDASINIFLRDKKVKVKTKFEDGKPTYKMNISFDKYEIRDIEQDNPPINVYRNFQSYLTKDVKDAAESRIEQMVIAAFEKAKTCGVDAFNVADRLNRCDTEKYKKYMKTHTLEDLLNDVQFSVKCVTDNGEY